MPNSIKVEYTDLGRKKKRRGSQTYDSGADRVRTSEAGMERCREEEEEAEEEEAENRYRAQRKKMKTKKKCPGLDVERRNVHKSMNRLLNVGRRCFTSTEDAPRHHVLDLWKKISIAHHEMTQAKAA